MRTWDCVVVGETCLDIVAGPLPLDQPLAHRGLVPLESVQAVTGGIVPNAGIALARLGLRTAAMGLVGRDPWGETIRRRLVDERIDVRDLADHDDGSSVTLVLVGADREHTFAFRAGASQRIDRGFLFERLDRFSDAHFALVGYYNLLPRLEPDLPEVMQAIQARGCRTALDTTNGGGTLTGLDCILPHLDLYVPSYSEARQQTGESEPLRILETYRRYAPRAILGVKLGADGALLWEPDCEPLSIAAVAPPGPIVDTTGAGDCFYAGLIAGPARGLPLAKAGRIAAAAGACCVTGLGASAGMRDWDATRKLALID